MCDGDGPDPEPPVRRRRNGLESLLGWLAGAAYAAGLVVLIPSWFGRPPFGWALLVTAVVLLAAGTLLGGSRAGARSRLVSGIGVVGGAGCTVAGVAILVASIVRAVALGDTRALFVGVAALVAGPLAGVGFLSWAIGAEAATRDRPSARP